MAPPPGNIIFTTRCAALREAMGAMILWTVVLVGGLEARAWLEGLAPPGARLSPARPPRAPPGSAPGSRRRPRRCGRWRRRPAAWTFGQDIPRPAAWMSAAGRALARNAFRQEILWQADAAQLEKTRLGLAENGMVPSGQTLYHLHHTDDVPDNVPARLFAYVLEGQGQIGPVVAVLLGDDLEQLVAAVRREGCGQAPGIQAVRGFSLGLEKAAAAELHETAALDDERAEVEDEVLRGLAAEAPASTPRPGTRLENEQYERPEFRRAADTFRTSSWQAGGDDAAARVMGVDRGGSKTQATLDALRATTADAQRKMKKLDVVMGNQTDPGVDRWFTEQENPAQIRVSSSAYDRYIADPRNKKFVATAFDS